MNLFLLIGILGYGVASIRGRGRVVPLGRVQAVPSGHPPGAACSSSVADGTSGTRTTLPSWWELGSLVQPSGDGVCNLKTGPDRPQLDFLVLDACFRVGEQLPLLASTSPSLVTWWSWPGNWSQKLSTPQASHFLAWGDHAHTSVVVGRTG